MDPQKLAQLDPKLRDAYQRVMGTTIPEPNPAPSQAQTPSPAGGPPTTNPSPIPQPQPQPEPNPAPSPIVEPTPPAAPTEEPSVPIQPTVPPTTEPQPAPLTPEPAVEPQPAINPQPQAMSAQPTSNFVQMNSEVAAAPTTSTPNFSAPAPETQTVAVKKKSGIMPILFGFVGLIFIAIYTIFWAKILNFKLPFLP